MTDFTILPNGLKVLSEHDAQALSVHVALPLVPYMTKREVVIGPEGAPT